MEKEGRGPKPEPATFMLKTDIWQAGYISGKATIINSFSK
jgi:hypothetical protein